MSERPPEPTDPVEKARYHLVEGRGHTNLRDRLKDALDAYDDQRIRYVILTRILDSPNGLSPREVEEIFTTEESRARARAVFQDMLDSGRLGMGGELRAVVTGHPPTGMAPDSPGLAGQVDREVMRELVSYAHPKAKLGEGDDTEAVEVKLVVPLVGRMKKGAELDHVPAAIWPRIASTPFYIVKDDEPYIVLFYEGGGNHRVTATDRRYRKTSVDRS